MSVRTIHQKSVSIILLILVLSVTPYFLIDKSECQSYPQKATYVLTLHPEKNEADIIYTIMVNNSQRSYADFTLNYDYFEEREIVDSKITMFPIMKGRMLDEASHNITVVPYENASRVKGTITFSLEGYSSAFFSLRYTIKDVFRTIEYKDDPEYHSLDFSVLLDSKDVTFAVRVPKHVEFFQTDALNFFAIEPSPSIEIEDGEFIKLVWNVPPQQLEGRFSQFNPAIIFNYKINSIFLIRQVLLTFILIFVAFIVERLLLVKIWPSVKGRVSPKSNKQISYQPLIPPVSSFSKKALLKEYEESRQMHNYYGKIIWEVLSIFFGGGLAFFGVVISQIEGKSPVPMLLAAIVTALILFVFAINRRFKKIAEIHLARCRQIEQILGLKQHTLVKEANESIVRINEGNRIASHEIPFPAGWKSTQYVIFAVLPFVWLIALYYLIWI